MSTTKKLANPEHGKPIDHAGMALTTEPIEGGYRTENLSVPVDHDARVVYRELSADEKRQRKEDAAGLAAFRRVDATIFLRLARDALLRNTDHLAGDDTWDAWRQDLRDLPATTKNPEEPVWPPPPAAISALLEHRRLWPDLDWSRLTGAE